MPIPKGAYVVAPNVPPTDVVTLDVAIALDDDKALLRIIRVNMHRQRQVRQILARRVGELPYRRQRRFHALFLRRRC